MALSTVVFVWILKTSAAVFLGPIFPVILISSIAYSIVRYQFLNIRLLLARAALYIILVTILSITLALSTIFLGQYLSDTYGLNEFLIVVLVSVFIVAFLEPIKRVFSKITDNIFYKSRVNHDALISDATTILNEELDLTKLTLRFTQYLVENLKVSSVNLYLAAGSNNYINVVNEENNADQLPENVHISESFNQDLAATEMEVSIDKYEYSIVNNSVNENEQKIVREKIEEIKAIGGAVDVIFPHKR